MHHPRRRRGKFGHARRAGHALSLLRHLRRPSRRCAARQPFNDATVSAVNVFNRVGSAWRIAPDTFGNSASYGSEYSCVAIFSDSGADTQDGVRVDVFVYRNFNPSKELSDNQKPVGYVSGYIERP